MSIAARTDPPGGFTTEHVLPTAFGAFRDALTLTDAVCGECNQYFGDHLDRMFARGSAEAVLRLHHGIKDPSGLPQMFRDRVRVRMPDDGDRWGGVILKFVAPPEGKRAPFVELGVPQVGLRAPGRALGLLHRGRAPTAAGASPSVRDRLHRSRGHHGRIGR